MQKSEDLPRTEEEEEEPTRGGALPMATAGGSLSGWPRRAGDVMG